MRKIFLLILPFLQTIALNVYTSRQDETSKTKLSIDVSICSHYIFLRTLPFCPTGPLSCTLSHIESVLVDVTKLNWTFEVLILLDLSALLKISSFKIFFPLGYEESFLSAYLTSFFQYHEVISFILTLKYWGFSDVKNYEESDVLPYL